jgi:hypothetical protein
MGSSTSHNPIGLHVTLQVQLKFSCKRVPVPVMSSRWVDHVANSNMKFPILIPCALFILCKKHLSITYVRTCYFHTLEDS